MQLFPEVQTRPYSFVEIVTRSVRAAFGSHFREFFVPALLLYVLWGAPPYMAYLAWFPQDAFQELFGSTHEVTPSDIFQLPNMVPFLAFTVAWHLLFAAIFIVAMQYFLRRMHQIITDERETVRATLRQALDPARFAAFVVAGLAAWFVSGLGFLFCVVPGVALALAYQTFLPSCLTFGRERFRVPLAEPFHLLEGRVVKTAGVSVTFWSALSVLSSLVQVLALFSHLAGTDLTAVDLAAYRPGLLDFAWAIIGSIIIVLFYITNGFANVVMYVNYRAVAASAPREDAPPGNETDLLWIYHGQGLADLGDPGPVPEGHPPYGSYSEAELMDAYRHINPEEFPERLNILLHEIKARVEQSGKILPSPPGPSPSPEL